MGSISSEYDFIVVGGESMLLEIQVGIWLLTVAQVVLRELRLHGVLLIAKSALVFSLWKLEGRMTSSLCEPTETGTLNWHSKWKNIVLTR